MALYRSHLGEHPFKNPSEQTGLGAGGHHHSGPRQLPPTSKSDPGEGGPAISSGKKQVDEGFLAEARLGYRGQHSRGDPGGAVPGSTVDYGDVEPLLRSPPGAGKADHSATHKYGVRVRHSQDPRRRVI